MSCWAHNPKVGGSNPPPATKSFQSVAAFRFCERCSHRIRHSGPTPALFTRMPDRVSQAVKPKLKQWRELVRKARVGVLFFSFAGCGFCQSTIRSSAIPPLRSDVLSTWTTDQGLPQNFVTSLAQTPDGFLWVGTLNGLIRFDGVNFRSFTNFGPPEMQDYIRGFFPDETGGLWISTNTGLFQYQGGRFT